MNLNSCYFTTGTQTITTAVEDIDKNEPTNTPSDNLPPHIYMK